MKQADMEVIEEKKELVYDILVEAMEDVTIY